MSRPSVASESSSAVSHPARRTSWSGALRLATLLLLALAFALRLWPLMGRSIDYDEGVYWQSLRAMSEGHPLFSSVFSSQPPFFLLALYPFYALLGQNLAAARLGVAIFSIIGILAMYALGRMLAGHWVGLLSALLLAVDPIYVQQSHSLQAEVPAVAFEIVCVALAVLATHHSGARRRLFVTASGLALGLGTMAKLFDVVAVVPVVLYVGQPVLQAVWPQPGKGKDANEIVKAARSTLMDLILFAVGVIVACAIVVAPYLSSFGAMYDQAVRFHLAAAHAANLGLKHNIGMLLRDGQQAPLAVLVLVAFALAFRARNLALIPPLAWLLASVLLLVKQQPLFVHHFALLSPALALSGALALPLAGAVWRADHAAARKRSWLRACVIGISAVVVLASLIMALGEVRSAAQPVSSRDARMAAALRAASLPGAVVVSDDQYIAGLAGRSVPPELVDTSQVRIQSGYLTAPQLESIIMRDHVNVILFASGRFNLIPGFSAWVQQRYSVVARFGNGAYLYVRTSSAPVPA